MVNFKIDSSELEEYLLRFKDHGRMSSLGERYLTEIYNEAIHFVHVDTGELMMSIGRTPVTYAGGGYNGEVFATSDHGIYEEARGGEHAFMTQAVQSAETLFPYIIEEWWNENFE